MIDQRFYQLRDHLWRGAKFGYYWTSDDGQGKKLTWWESLPTNDEIPKLFHGVDAYFGVHPSNIRRSEHERAHITDIDVINTFYVEFDCKTDEAKKTTLEKIARLPIQPACVVDSGGGYHCYFWLRDTYHLDTLDKRQRAADLQWAFVQWAGGDSSVNDLARVLRIPGTINHKAHFAPNFPVVCIVRWDTSQQHELSEIEPLLQPYIDARAASKAHSHATPSMGSVSLDDDQLLDVMFRSKNGDLYRRLWDGDDLGDHSVADQKLCNGLAWLTGRDINTMDRLFRQSGLYRPKWETDSYRERTLNNAANSAQQVYTPSQVDQEAVKAVQAAVGMNGTGSHSTPNGASAPQAQPPKGLTSTQQATIDFLFAAGEWDLLAAICAKIPVKHGRPYLKSKFLILHNNNEILATDELQSYYFAGTPISKRVEADLIHWGYSFAENELDGTIYCKGQPLDEATRALINLNGRDNNYGGKGQPALTTLPETILVMGRRNRYHPVRDWLNGLVWDGQAHLTQLLAFFKDKHTPITYSGGSTMSVFGAFLMRWMQGAIARAFGDKDAQNPVLVLAGSQGIGKSYLPKWLCSAIPELFVEGSIDPENPDHRRLLVTRFIWEISELPSTMNKADANGLKSFLTTGEATFRVPYAKDPITRPGLASFVGTLNPTTGHLIDVTGNRRFLSVELDAIDQAYSSLVNVEQLWAEALYYYNQKVGYKLSNVEEEAQSNLNIASRMTNDTTEALLKYYDIDPNQSGWFEYTIDIVEHLREKQHRTDVTKVGTELRGMLGYGSEQRVILSRRGRGFYGIQKK